MIHSYLKPESGRPALDRSSSEFVQLSETFRLQHKFNPAIVYKKTADEKDRTKQAISRYPNKNHRP